ncbi:MAG: autotransporter-associated beta strand repeat-containing protein [Thermoguttaceae bacterium]|jgi:autotransporter-associated beta strand protein
MGSHTRQFLIALLAALACTPLLAATLPVTGTINGILNGAPILGTSSGTLNTLAGAGAFTATLGLPNQANNLWNWPCTGRLSCCTVVGPEVYNTTYPAVNLQTLAPNGFNYENQYWWTGVPGTINVGANVSISTGQQVTYALNWNETYGGPTDLTGVTNCAFRWTPIEGGMLETGTATVTRTGGQSFPLNWSAKYTWNGASLPADQTGTVTYDTQNYSVSTSGSNATGTMNLAYHGTVQLANDAATWTGGDSSDNWGKPNNFGGTTLPPGAALKFGPLSNGHATNNNDLTANTSFNGIAFLPGAPAYSLQGNAITLAGPVVNTSTNDQTIGLNMALASGGGAFDTGSNNVTVSGTISDPMPASPAALTKYGSGTLFLTGSNTYSGGTFVNEGTLQGDCNSLQGNIVANSNVVFNQIVNGSFTGSLSGGGTITKTGPGTLNTDSPPADPQGPLPEYIIQNGKWVFNPEYPNQPANRVHSFDLRSVAELDLSGDTLTTGSLVGTGGTVNIGGSTQFGSLTVNATDNSSMNFAGRLTGYGGLNLLGNSTLTLAGLVDYTDGTHIGGGTLNTSGNFSPGGTVTVDPGAGFTLQGTLPTSSIVNNGMVVFSQTANATFAGSLSGTGTVVMTNTGTLTMGLGAWLQNVGATLIVNHGIVILDGCFDQGGAAIGSLSALSVFDPAILQVSGNTLTTGLLQGGGTINLGGTGQLGNLTVNATNSMTFAGRLTGNGGLTLSGNSSLTLAGLVDYTDGTHIGGGSTLNTTGTFNPGGTVTVDAGAQFVASGPATVGGLAGSGTAQVSGTMSLTQQAAAWPGNTGAQQNIGMLIINAGGHVDVKNNLINVNYGNSQSSPYVALAGNVNSGAVTQTAAASNRTVGIYDTALNLDGTTPGGTTVRLGYACPGDTMLRGQVTSSDIINILSAGKYNIGPSNARWDQGDFTHDGKVDSSDIIAMLQAGTYNNGTYPSVATAGPALVIGGLPSAGRATIIYNAASGDVEIDPDGNTMTGFRLWDSAGNFFVGSPVFPPGGAFTTDDATQKFWGCFNPPNYLTSVVDLGDIAPAGLTNAQFMAAMNNSSGDSVWTKAGGGSFDYNFNPTPEPSTLALLAVGGLLCLGWAARRRRV